MGENKHLKFINSKYKTQFKSNFILDIEFFTSFYLPIIENKAFALYLFLFTEGKNNFTSNVFLPSNRIIDFLDLTVEEIEKFLKYLEFLNLLLIYKNKDDNKYIFVLKKPLSLEEFKNNFKLTELLISKIGDENYKLNLKLFSLNNFKNTRYFSLENIEQEISNESDKIIERSKRFNFSPLFEFLEDQKINYLKFWNDELEEQITDLIFLYNLTILDIVNLIKFMIKNQIKINIANLELNCKEKFDYKLNSLDKFIGKAEVNLNNRKKLMKNTHPLKYIELIFDRNVNNSEKNIIVELIDTYNFNYFKINGLIDYSKMVNNGRITKNYILKIANSLKDEKIIDDDDFVKFLKDKYNYRKNKANIDKKNSKNITDSKKKNDDEILGDNIFDFWKEIDENKD